MEKENLRFDPTRKRGAILDATGYAHVTGPCADLMEIWLRTEEGVIREAGYETNGCWSSQAAGSAVAQLVEGKAVAEARGLAPKEVLDFIGGLAAENEHCAKLALDTLHAALDDAELQSRASAVAPKEPVAPKPSTCEGCSDSSCSARQGHPDENPEQAEARRAIRRRLCRIGRTILVLSGKGGVGKSTVAVNLAAALARAGARVGVLDIDVHGPSVPRMLGVDHLPVHMVDDAILPVRAGSLRVMSVAFFLRQFGDAVVWRGPMKMSVIQQFLKDVEWGDLDWLVVDSPPGTGDEPLSACQLIGSPDGAVIVTTPQQVAVDDVRRSVNFCRLLHVPVLGIVENMSGFVCPHCGKETEIFRRGGGEELAAEENVPLLGRVPLDPGAVASGDEGKPLVFDENPGPAGRSFIEIARAVRQGFADKD